MSVVFRATDAPAAMREEYWRQVLADTIVPMDVRLDDGPTARDEIVAGSLGAVRVVQTRSGPGEARRTARQTRRTESDGYQLFVQGRGSVIATQDRHQVELTRGDLSLTTLGRPFHCVHPARQAILLRFPRALLPLPEREVSRVMGAPIRGDRGIAALVFTLASRLPRHLDDGGGPRLGSALIDLLTAALGDRLDCGAGVSPATQQRALLLRVHAFIEAQLADPELTPTTVAAAHHISVRSLHKLFESEQATVADHIRHRRLDRCSRDLLDPALSARPASAVGARWGFGSAAHFSRVFRDAYGLPPGEYRRAYGPCAATG